MGKDIIFIKPHHLIDIIKLYGAGIEHFVKDEAFQHDFYKVANKIINNCDCLLQFTTGGDDICKPCNRFDGQKCTDALSCVNGYLDKETYNRVLDNRIIDILRLDLDETYSVRQILTAFQGEPNLVFHVWIEENEALTDKRNALFQCGCLKLLTKAIKNL